MIKSKVVITGINGQDGFYLSKLLIEKGYEVHGLVRCNSLHKELDKELKNKVNIHEVDFNSFNSLYETISLINPIEIYHLAGYTLVDSSLENEFRIMNYNVTLTHYILSIVKNINNNCKVFFAGTSEMFGEPIIFPQNEETKFNPKSIYGVSKLSANALIKYYRKYEKLFACTGILYNHESPKRREEFVTRKITKSVARIKEGLENELFLGNLDGKRDWGHAKDYVKAMWLMLQNDKPKDYVIATGRLFSIRDFLEKSFSYVGLDYTKYVKIDKNFYRPSENIPLCGNPSLIKKDLNWQSEITIDELVIEMVENDINLLNERKK